MKNQNHALFYYSTRANFVESRLKGLVHFPKSVASTVAPVSKFFQLETRLFRSTEQLLSCRPRGTSLHQGREEQRRLPPPPHSQWRINKTFLTNSASAKLVEVTFFQLPGVSKKVGQQRFCATLSSRDNTECRVELWWC